MKKETDNPFLKKYSGTGEVLNRSMFKQKKTEGPGKIINLDPTDKVRLPLINDRIYESKKMLQMNRDEHSKICLELEKARKIYAEKKVKMRKQWKELEEAELSLRHTVLFYNKFIKENAVKRERFQENAKFHIPMQEKYMKQSEKMKKSIAELEDVIAKMKYQLKSHTVYEDFLEKLVSPSGQFKSPSDLITRFEDLYATTQETTSNLVAKKLELEDILVELTKTQFDWENIVFYLTNKIGFLHEDYLRAVAESNEMEEVLRDIEIETLKKGKDYGDALETMSNMYISICRRQGVVPCYRKGDYNNHLLIINTELHFLKKVIAMVEEEQEEEESEDLPWW